MKVVLAPATAGAGMPFALTYQGSFTSAGGRSNRDGAPPAGGRRGANWWSGPSVLRVSELDTFIMLYGTEEIYQIFLDLRQRQSVTPEVDTTYYRTREVASARMATSPLFAMPSRGRRREGRPCDLTGR